jgi:hypothetical protein
MCTFLASITGSQTATTSQRAQRISKQTPKAHQNTLLSHTKAELAEMVEELVRQREIQRSETERRDIGRHEEN